jgi:hypothetical protein
MTDLSSAAFSAATAVALSPDERQTWFEVLGGLDLEPNWDLAAPALTAAAAEAGVAAGTVEEFLAVLADGPDPMATLAELRAAGPDLIEEAYLAATAEPEEAAAGGGEFDDAAWTEFLHTNGAGWSREEDTWPPFRVWFLYEADQGGFGEPARAFIEYAESRDKAQTFDDYQVPHADTAGTEPSEPAEPAAPDVSAYPEVKEGDQGEWVAYADTLLTQAGY